MKFAVVIPTLNAVLQGGWEYVLSSYDFQNIQAGCRLILDSSSNDETVELAEDRNWEVISVERKKFNHGKTRQMAVEMLSGRGYEVVIFATQDAILASPDTLCNLLDNLRSTGAAVVYARQQPFDSLSVDGSARLRNYPEKSMLKTLADVPAMGLMAAFCSNTLAAWRVDAVMAAGGFPAASFGEDMLMAAKLLKMGEKVSYCAESICYHSHEDSIVEFWKRGVDIGVLHREHAWLAHEFGSPEGGAVKQLKFRSLPLQIVKYLGFLYGKNCKN